MESFEAFLNKYLVEKAPALPEAARRFLASLAPWLCGLGILTGLLGLLAVLGIGIGTSSFLLWGSLGMYGAYALSPSLWLAMALSGVMVVFEILAFPGLMKKNYQGWRWLFYSSLVGLVSGILSYDGLIGAIISAIIGWYLLFQIRPLYAGAPTLPAGPTPHVPPSHQAPGGV